MLKDIRYLIKEFVPELEPEYETMTEERKRWKQMTLQEQFDKTDKIKPKEKRKPNRTRPANKDYDLER